MPRSEKIPLARIKAAQKRLRGLPPKDDAKSKEEALELLTEYLRHGLQKGYSLKDLRAVLTEERVILPAVPMKKRLSGQDEKGEALPEKILPETAPQILPATEENPAPKKSYSYRGFTIKPDTPDEEL